MSKSDGGEEFQSELESLGDRRGSFGGEGDLESQADGQSKSRNFDVKFIRSTYFMVEDCHQDHPDILSWAKDGDAFEVKDIDALESSILPRYFNSNKYSSFVRQLNKYDFNRDKPNSSIRNKGKPTTVVRDIFNHRQKFFKRGQRELLTKIKRKYSQSGNKKMATSNDSDIQDLKNRIHSLEEGQEKMLKTIQKLQAALDEKVSTPPARGASDIAIDRLEYRLRSVESCLFTLTRNQSQRYPCHRGSFPPLSRDESSWRTNPFPTDDGLNSLPRFSLAPPMRFPESNAPGDGSNSLLKFPPAPPMRLPRNTVTKEEGPKALPKFPPPLPMRFSETTTKGEPDLGYDADMLDFFATEGSLSRDVTFIGNLNLGVTECDDSESDED